MKTTYLCAVALAIASPFLAQTANVPDHFQQFDKNADGTPIKQRLGPGDHSLTLKVGSSLELETLLHNVLKNCRLKRSSETESTYVITATPGWLWRKRVRVREMVLECDRETRAIRRLVVHRDMPEQGTVTTTFTLVEARAADESRYRPEGHLTAPYEILSQDSNDARRREILANWFGRDLDRWIKQPPRKSD